MNRIIDRAVDAFNSRFHIGPIIMTMITVFLILMPYDSSESFNLIAVFLTFIILISTALMVISCVFMCLFIY